VCGLVFSDVVGNRLDVIASGPTAPDESTFADARAVLNRYGIQTPDAISAHLARGADGDYPETPGPDGPLFESVTNHVLADSHTALGATADEAREAGFAPLVLSSCVRGEAREVAKTLTGIAEESADTGRPVEPPAVLLSGGETTVTLAGDGGPDQEFTLSAALELAGPDVAVAAVDTDGIDGNADAAGAVASQLTGEAVETGQTALVDNDTADFFERHGGAIVTGPTGTNVNDLRAFVVPDR